MYYYNLLQLLQFVLFITIFLYLPLSFVSCLNICMCIHTNVYLYIYTLFVEIMHIFNNNIDGYVLPPNI